MSPIQGTIHPSWEYLVPTNTPSWVASLKYKRGTRNFREKWGHQHTQPGQHQFPKNFIVASGKTSLVSLWGTRRREWRGQRSGESWGMVWGMGAWGRTPLITKIKGFYKKGYKLVSKEKKIKQTPQEEAGGGSKGRWEEGREEGP